MNISAVKNIENVTQKILLLRRFWEKNRMWVCGAYWSASGYGL